MIQNSYRLGCVVFCNSCSVLECHLSVYATMYMRMNDVNPEMGHCILLARMLRQLQSSIRERPTTTMTWLWDVLQQHVMSGTCEFMPEDQEYRILYNIADSLQNIIII